MLAVCVPVLAVCVPVLAVCVPVLAVCVLVLAVCVPVLAVCVPVLAVCVPVLTVCVPVLAVCVPVLALSVPVLAISVPVLAVCVPVLAVCVTVLAVYVTVLAVCVPVPALSVPVLAVCVPVLAVYVPVLPPRVCRRGVEPQAVPPLPCELGPHGPAVRLLREPVRPRHGDPDADVDAARHPRHLLAHAVSVHRRRRLARPLRRLLAHRGRPERVPSARVRRADPRDDPAAVDDVEAQVEDQEDWQWSPRAFVGSDRLTYFRRCKRSD